MDTLTLISFQNCQEDESLYVATILRNTKKTHSVRHGHSHGFIQTYDISLSLLPSQNNQHQANNKREHRPPHNLLIVPFKRDGRW